jgi:phage tail sheath protein FI
VQDPSGTGSTPSGPAFTDSSAPPAAQPTGIAASATGVVAFVGRCLKGPINEPLRVTSFVEYQQAFGGLWSGSTLSYAVQQYFEHGGRDALIVRVASAGRPPTLDLPAGDDTLVLTGVCPGTREFLRVSVDYDGISPQDTDLFNLVVQRVRSPGSELVEAQEIFRRLSVLEGSAREIGRMLASSRLVRLLGRLPRQRPDISRGPDPRSVIGYVLCNKDGDDGRDLSEYDLIGSEAGHAGLFALQGGPPFNFLCIPPPAADCDLGMSALVVAARFCRRHHALLLVDPPRAWRTAEHALEGMRSWPLQSADAVMFFPWIVAKDRLTAKLATFAPSGAAAGLIVRDDRNAGDFWRSGETALLRPSAQPATNADESQRSRLARWGVNVLAATRTATKTCIPARTLAGERSSPPEGRLLSERRLAQFVSSSIERGTRWVALEGNSERSRERVRRQVERFLQQLAESGALAGNEHNRHYFVLCDERLNGVMEQVAGEFRLAYGYQSREAVHRKSWLVVHRAADSETRSVTLNPLAAQELR